MVLGFTLTGCSGGGSGRVVNVCGWGENIDPDLIDQFEEETGITVNYSEAESNESMYSLIKQGGTDYDVIVPSDYMIGKMIQEGCSPAKDSAPTSDLLSLRNTLLLGLALSIDALISGFSLGLIKVALLPGSQFKNILISALLIGITAALISAIGLRIGRFASTRLGPKAEIFGGIILIGIGVKIVIDHLS